MQFIQKETLLLKINEFQNIVFYFLFVLKFIVNILYRHTEYIDIKHLLNT